MEYENIDVVSPIGIYGRKALKLQQASEQYQGDIYLVDDKGRRVSGSSILGILSLGINEGDKFQICVSKNTENTEETIKHLLGIIGGAKR